MTTAALKSWVAETAALTTPDRVVWCDGSEEEKREIEAAMIADGSLTTLDWTKYPGCYLYRSDPSDVARTEQCTFICSASKDDAGPTNNWMSPEDAAANVRPLFAGAMKGRTMYVVPYLLGPVGSPHSRVGVEITDSPYVVLSMRIMTRMGVAALAELHIQGEFVRGLHATGTLDPKKRFICHFPERREIWSVNSGYGGNALLSKKCHALRLASVQARDEGWMAEHMTVFGLTGPDGATTWFAAAFPSGCGKTNLAMLVPSLPGWSIETLGEDIAWLFVGDDGRLRAINAENGMFGVAPGTGWATNPNAMRAVGADTIFTNVALAPGRVPWWEGMSDRPQGFLVGWDGAVRKPDDPAKVAHPNARFTVNARRCPTVGAAIDDPKGVPISGIIFGGRRARLAPLVYESFGWAHGVYVGATMVSETTAAATGAVGVPRNDPMAMLPFCGYHMGDYFAHWLRMGARLAEPPRIFHVNWFRTADDGSFLWPGYGDNVRALAWMVDRIRDGGAARETAIGNVPAPDALALDDLGLAPEQAERLLDVDPDAWTEEWARQDAFLAKFGGRLPQELREQHMLQLHRLSEPRKPT